MFLMTAQTYLDELEKHAHDVLKYALDLSKALFVKILF